LSQMITISTIKLTYHPVRGRLLSIRKTRMKPLFNSFKTT